MAIVGLDQLLFLPPAPGFAPNAATPNFSTTPIRLNAAGDYVAFVLSANRSGDVEEIFWRTGPVTTGCTVDVRLETVDTTTGLPTGTLVNAGANASQVVANTDDNQAFQTALGTAATLTRGELYAVVFDVLSGTPSSLCIACFVDPSSLQSPYVIEYDGTASLISGYAPIMGLLYSGGVYQGTPGAWPITNVWTQSYAATDSPDTYGAAFSLSHQSRVCGFWFWGEFDGDGTAKLYDSDGATVLESAAIYENVAPSGSSLLQSFFFGSSVTLAEDTTYYLAIEATDSTDIVMYGVEFSSAAWRDASPLGGRWQLAQCTQSPTGTGDWTNTGTKQAFIGLIVDGLEEAGGGGGSSVAVGQGLHSIDSGITA